VLAGLAKIDALVIDDWAITPMTADASRDLLEVLDDRHQRRSTLVTSQLAVKHRHDYLANPTIADAILDRLVQNSHRITLQGESLRKAQRPELERHGLTEPALRPSPDGRLASGSVAGINWNRRPASSEYAHTC